MIYNESGIYQMEKWEFSEVFVKEKQWGKMDP